MSETTSAERPAVLSALETISVLLIAGQVLLGGIEFGIQTVFDVLWWGLILWLVLKVTRRGSGRARIILTALFALGIALFLGAIAYLGPSWQEVAGVKLDGILLAGSVVMWALNVAQIVLLWAPVTTRWIEQHEAVRGSE
jgi:hypothetical protein